MGADRVLRRCAPRTRPIARLSLQVLPRPALSIGGAMQTVRPLDRTQADRGGEVIATFRSGCYVRFDKAVFAIGGSSMHAGPLHLVVDGVCPRFDEGKRATMTADCLSLHGFEIGLHTATLWAPSCPDLASLFNALPTIEQIASSLTTPIELDAQWGAIERAAETQEFSLMRELLEGRGSGLTPVGDDVLAGALLLHAMARPGAATVRTVAADARTTTLSRRFLHWAARGQCIEPVHRMINEAGSGQTAAAHQSAEIIRGVGASSGEALIIGLALAARGLQRDDALRASRPFVKNP